jgi:hypothetical protein
MMLHGIWVELYHDNETSISDYITQRKPSFANLLLSSYKVKNGAAKK